MLKNYFKTAWRNLSRNRTFSFINTLGLALGLACSLLIIVWVRHERSIDAFHANDDNLYVLYEQQIHDGVIDGGYSTPGVLASELKIVFPEVRYATSTAWVDENTFEGNHKHLKARGDFGSPDFFSVFSYPLLKGTPETALLSNVDIAISRKMAEDFFGSAEAAFGQPIRLQDINKDLKITAVFENIVENSSTKFDYVINWETFLETHTWARQWDNNGPSTFIVLHEGHDPAAFEDKIRDFLRTYKKSDDKNFIVKFGVQRYSERYLHSSFKNGEIVGGRILYVKLFSVIAVFILLIACINFMNLTTARSVKRSKEIGVRKVIGAVRTSLIRQFLGETLLIVVISFVLALLFVILVLPIFGSVTQKRLVLPLEEPFFWIGMFALALITAMISGSYPAFYLSSFNPVRAFKGALKFSAATVWFRKGLVIFQFVLSILLIIGTIVISRQISYLQTANLGYDRENLIYIPLEGTLKKQYVVMKDMALRGTGVHAVSRISNNPTSIENGTGGVEWEGKDPNATLQFTQSSVGYDFVSTMDIKLLQGRDFSRDFASDSVGYVVNEKALKLFNYKEPIGMPLTFWGQKGTIVGVMKDFHFNSLHIDIAPLILRLREVGDQGGWAVVRTSPGKTKEALATLESICKDLNPEFPFTYQFSEEEYQWMYNSERIVGKLSNAFAFLGIFISCLGLLGLAMFTAEQRTKEIGIRKVLGASMTSLFGLLSREFFLLVIAALIIASPIAWYLMNDWLSEFAYRIDIAWWIFVVAGLLALVITLFTISFQTIKALLMNPVNSLRSE